MDKQKVIGVVKLNTNFPRLIGDIGNPESFQYPVEYITVTSAVPANVTIAEDLTESLQQDFITATKALLEKEVSLITTTCGFLSTMQPQLAQLSNTPTICSALTLLPLLASIHGGTKNIGVLTFNAETLNANHTAGFIPGAIEGLLPTDSLRRVISADLRILDEVAARDNVLTACERLLIHSPNTKAIVLECTNLSPYKAALREHAKLPVYDIVDAIHWLLQSQP